jgi:DNA replication initiation complex subunit (GINS family)
LVSFLDVMLTYNDIYESLRKEKYSEQLQPLGKKFVSLVSQYLIEKKKTIEKDSGFFSEDSVKLKKQLENAKDIFNELMLLRKKKILGLVFVASETGISKRDFENMLDFEKELFDKLIANVKEAEKKLELEFDSEVVENDMALILILEDIGELVGFGGESVGPFTKGEMVNLEKKVADILVEDGKAEFVEND